MRNLENIKVSKDDFLASDDEVSCITIVPINGAIDITENKLHDDPKLEDRTKVKVKDVTELLSLVFNTTCLQYKDTIYQAKKWCCYGSPPLPVVANIELYYYF